MSSRTNIRPFKAITAGDMSLATITSIATVLQSVTGISYQLSWTGSSPVGTAALQVSNDYSVNGNVVINAGTWTTLPFPVSGTFGNSIAITGNSGNAFIDDIHTNAYAIRLLYTKSSGTGSLTVVFNGKVS